MVGISDFRSLLKGRYLWSHVPSRGYVPQVPRGVGIRVGIPIPIPWY